jgi:2-keto-4-pentenoate hydratase
MSLSVQVAVDRIVDARLANAMLEPLFADGDCSVEYAYTVQDAVRNALVQRGQHPIGWKLAATGPVGQALLGVTEPIFGLLMPHAYRDGEKISSAAFANLHVEAEIAFRLRSELAGPGVTPAAARAAIECVMPALELPDLCFSGSQNAINAIANGALAKAIVLGSETAFSDDVDLKAEEVSLEHNSKTISTNRGSDIMGDPLNAIAWLSNQLSARGHKLIAGNIIMSGGISQLIKPGVGDTVTAKFSQLGSVTMTVDD